MQDLVGTNSGHICCVQMTLGKKRVAKLAAVQCCVSLTHRQVQLVHRSQSSVEVHCGHWWLLLCAPPALSLPTSLSK